MGPTPILNAPVGGDSVGISQRRLEGKVERLDYRVLIKIWHVNPFRLSDGSADRRTQLLYQYRVSAYVLTRDNHNLSVVEDLRKFLPFKQKY